jgi:REP element-mobilizing transposase RayT
MTTPAALCHGQYYHINNRGNNRENIFLEDRNYLYFMELYAYHVAPVLETFAYCLLRNHFHFLVRVKSEGEIQTFRVLGKDELCHCETISEFYILKGA